MGRKAKRLVWIALSGHIEATADGFVYTPPKGTAELSPGVPPFGIAKTDIFFRGGTVSFTTRLKRREDKVQLVLNQGAPTEVFVGLNPANAAYGILVSRGGQWEGLKLAGTPEVLTLDKDYTVRVDVLGSQIRLFVDSVEVCRANYVIQKAQLAVFVMSPEPIQVSRFFVSAKQPTVFVVMQFTKEFDALYEEVIRPVCKEFGYESERAKDRYTSGLVVEDIVRRIDEAEVIIADVTPDNSNVFYEVGYSHGLNKPTILLSDRKRETLPFNIAGFRTLFYDNTIGGKSTVESRLRDHLREISSSS